MDAAFYDSAAKLVDAHVVDQARQVEKTNRRPVQELVDQRRLPAKGWSDDAVEKLLRDCAAMDSNNFEENVGVGEREARVLSGVVRRRHFGLAHGVGRSGDVAAVQPKAAGSSLLAKLANALALDALKEAGLVEFRRAVVLPCATGLSLSLCLLALRNQLPPTERAKKSKALWCRVDQKSCFKGILLAGLEAEVVAPCVDGSAPVHNRKTQPPSSNDELRTNLEDLERRLQSDEDVFCIVTTTSCFAPRAPDDVVGVARLCLKHNVRHVVNNAYGVQCSKTCAQIARASRVGRVDVVVASPVRRTRESAEILAEALGVPLEEEPGIAEMEFGHWDGLTFAEVAEKHGPELEGWAGSVDVAPQGGESFATVQERLRAYLHRRKLRTAGHAVRAVHRLRVSAGQAPTAPDIVVQSL